MTVLTLIICMLIINSKIKTALILTLFLLIFSTSTINAQVVINEYLPHPSSGNDWIEIYSPTDLDISGYILRDTTSDIVKLPSGVIIGPSKSTSCYLDVGNRLNNGGDTILILKADGLPPAVDEHSYSSDPGVDVSWCRTPDGGLWASCTAITKTSIECGSLVPSPSPTPELIQTPRPAPTPTKTPAPTLPKSPTPVPTQKPTATPKSTLQPTVKATPTPNASETEEPRQGNDVALITLENNTPSPAVEVAGASDEQNSFPALALLPILGGLGLVGASILSLYKQRLELKKLLGN